jgi:hypothetical protein
MKYEGTKDYTFDIDANGIEAEKKTPKMTYKGFKGYMPTVGHFSENGFVIGNKFKKVINPLETATSPLLAIVSDRCPREKESPRPVPIVARIKARSSTTVRAMESSLP